MSMLARSEDFERLAVRWAAAPHEARTPAEVIAAISDFPRRFAADRDSLPQNDTDRAFALVGKASDILDDAVFDAQTDEKADELTCRAAGYLDEALRLDPNCFDALRVRRSLDGEGRDSMVTFLEQGRERVRDACLAASAEAGVPVPDGAMSSSVFMRPYLRWELALATEQLNCGRYTRSLEVCGRVFGLDAADAACARYVAAYDYVKLEDAEGLAALIARFPKDERCAWFLLARCILAYRSRRLEEAADILHDIVRTFPDAGGILTFQEELPAGTFGHLDYAPHTSDELYVAVSEAAVLLDENCGEAVSPLSDWIARDALVQQAKESEDAYRAVHGADSEPPAAASDKNGGR